MFNSEQRESIGCVSVLPFVMEMAVLSSNKGTHLKEDTQHKHAVTQTRCDV